ncbi:MAG: hypothetical protein Ct9H300mP11_08840 [Chloroflexota bacterium]|nr:MAG: hypothetical protein Ct9H300mP11_08840 [Chloroflexota bacterium]
MTTHEVILHPASVVAELKKNDISHVVWLPDSETNFMSQTANKRTYPRPSPCLPGRRDQGPSPLDSG